MAKLNMSGSFLAFASLVLISCLWDSVDAKSLVLIGGALADTNADIWDKVIELGGGRGVARIGIITAASSDPLGSAAYYVDMLTQYGAAETYFIPVYEGNEAANSDPDVVNNILRMTGFMFGGGDQARVITCFYNAGRVESPALVAIRQVYDNGGMASGSSAGMACLSWAVMIMGGVSYNALQFGAFPAGEAPTSSDLVYDPYGALPMIHNYVLDTHFSERGREGRLIRLLSDTRADPFGVQFGVGADEDTALVVTDVDTPAAVGEAVGVAGVVVVDISQSVLDDTAPYFHISNVRLHYLTHGDRMNMTSRDVTFDPSWKQDLTGRESLRSAITSTDIFGGPSNPNSKPEFVKVSTSLVDASQDTATFGTAGKKAPIFRVSFYQDVDTRGFDGISPVTGKREISYSRMRVEIDSE